MDLQNLVQWTRTRLSRMTGTYVPVTSSLPLESPCRGRAAPPLFDLFENDREFRLVVDVPGATPTNTHLAWSDRDTLSVHVRREAAPPGVLSLVEYDAVDWYRELVLSPEADGTKAHATVRDGVLVVRVPKRPTLGSKLAPVYAA